MAHEPEPKTLPPITCVRAECLADPTVNGRRRALLLIWRGGDPDTDPPHRTIEFKQDSKNKHDPKSDRTDGVLDRDQRPSWQAYSLLLWLIERSKDKGHKKDPLPQEQAEGLRGWQKHKTWESFAERLRTIVGGSKVLRCTQGAAWIRDNDDALSGLEEGQLPVEFDITGSEEERRAILRWAGVPGVPPEQSIEQEESDPQRGPSRPSSEGSTSFGGAHPPEPGELASALESVLAGNAEPVVETVDETDAQAAKVALPVIPAPPAPPSSVVQPSQAPPPEACIDGTTAAANADTAVGRAAKVEPSVIPPLPVSQPSVPSSVAQRPPVPPTTSVRSSSTTRSIGSPEWLDGIRSWWRSGLAVLAALILGGIEMRRDWHEAQSWQDARNWCDYLQFWVVLAVFIDAVRKKPRALSDVGWKEAEKRECRECVAQFRFAWQMLWLIWAVFYLIHSGRHIAESKKLFWESEPDLPLWWSLVTIGALDLMHFFHSAMFTGLFWSMYRKTSSDRLYQFVLFTMVGVVIMAVADGAFLVSAFMSGHFPNEGVVVALVVGVVVAASQGMLIGRLESRYLDVDPLEVLLLCLYTCTQPLFRIMAWMEYMKWPSDVANLRPIAQVTDFWLKLLALGLKLGLYAVVYRQIRKGRLAFYMLNVRIRGNKMDKEWEDFAGDQLERSTPRHSAGPKEGSAAPK